MARRLGDAVLEAEVQVDLTQAAILQDDFGRAREILATTLSLARASGARYAEKFALDRLGFALGRQGDQAGALSHLERALALAVDLGDRRHQADLHWRIAIHHADKGLRPRAIASAQATVDILRSLGNPRADWYELSPGEIPLRRGGRTSRGCRYLLAGVQMGESRGRKHPPAGLSCRRRAAGEWPWSATHGFECR